MLFEYKSLTPNVDRIIAALLYVMREAGARGFEVSQYDLVKTLFLADRAHLNSFGRPITFDNYFAMKHGPVPTTAYDLLKGNERTLWELGIEELPWTSRTVEGSKKLYLPKATDWDLEDFLSPSDFDALKDSLSTVHSLGFSQIRRLTHEDPAYVEAWKDNGDRYSYPMKLDLLLDEPNIEQTERLVEYSQYV